MTQRRDPDSIRPGLLLIAAAVLGASLVAMTVVVRDALGLSSGGEGSSEVEREGGRRIVLRPDVDEEGLADGEVIDVGPEGSVREQWAEWTEQNGAVSVPPLVEALTDPQLSRFRASFEPEADLPFRPTGRRGRITSSRGLDLPPDASCDVRVLPVADPSGFNCLVRVVCGGVVVYPNQSQTAGYVACEVDGRGPQRAEDSMPSVRDGDPSILLDLASGTVQVGDRDHESSLYDVTIALDSTPVRVM